MSAALLSFADIQFGYQPENHLVLDGLWLDIRAGSVTAILGPNGSGKTTLLRLALGWLKPSVGEVLLAGRQIKRYSRHELGRWMGLVPQTEHIPYAYSLLEYVLLGRAPYLKPLQMPGEEDVQVAQQALARVGLEKLRKRSVLTLSGGEKQLVLVARALAQQPRLLLLDEPTAHLDLGNKYRLLRLLSTLAAQGVTVLFTTHEPEVAAAIASDVVLMRDGRVQHAGAINETLTSEQLSETYGIPVQVRQVDGRRFVTWDVNGDAS